MINPNLYYSPRDVVRLAQANLFPIRSRTTLQKLLSAGLIHHIRIGVGERQGIKIKGEELLRYMEFGSQIEKLTKELEPVEIVLDEIPDSEVVTNVEREAIKPVRKKRKNNRRKQ